jgi:hypothetical protein
MEKTVHFLPRSKRERECVHFMAKKRGREGGREREREREKERERERGERERVFNNLRTTISFSTEAIQGYFDTNSAQWFQLSQILFNTCYCFSQ